MLEFPIKDLSTGPLFGPGQAPWLAGFCREPTEVSTISLGECASPVIKSIQQTRDRISQALRSSDREWPVLVAILFATDRGCGSDMDSGPPRATIHRSRRRYCCRSPSSPPSSFRFPAWVIGERWMRRWIDGVPVGDTAVRRLSEEEYRGLIARSWTDLPRNWKVFKFLYGVGTVAMSACVADVMLNAQGADAWLGVHLGAYFAAYAVVVSCVGRSTGDRGAQGGIPEPVCAAVMRCWSF